MTKSARKILNVLDSKLRGKKAIPKSVNQVSVVFVTDREIHKLNRDFRSKNEPTDVLSFSLLEGLSGLVPVTSLGDVVISTETAKKQSIEYKVTVEQEILRLLIHGILHLCGFDHENVPKRRVREMQDFEDLLFAECGARL